METGTAIRDCTLFFFFFSFFIDRKLHGTESKLHRGDAVIISQCHGGAKYETVAYIYNKPIINNSRRN